MDRNCPLLSTHNYAVNPDHMCGCRCVKTCVPGHVCVCVRDDCKRKEFNTFNWQSRLHNPHAIISQQWCQNSPCAPSPSEARAVHLLPWRPGSGAPQGSRCSCRHLCSSIIHQEINTDRVFSTTVYCSI